MNLKKSLLYVAVSLLFAPALTSCLGDNDNSFDYTAWRNENEIYFTRMQDTIGADGKKVYESITPVWAPGVSILAQWHNDRSLTEKNLVPMDNSTCKVIYDAYYVNGTRLDYSWRTNADSLYTCKPSDNIVGFWVMLTNMHVGDSVTCVIPMNAAYGVSSSSVMPYSTLIYHMKLQAITAYEMAGK